MSKEKKIGLFVGCCVLIILLPFTCTVNKYREVKDAAVCGENGDIAFAFTMKNKILLSNVFPQTELSFIVKVFMQGAALCIWSLMGHD